MTKKNNIIKTKKMGVTNYPVGDFLIRLKNAALVNIKDVDAPSSNFVMSVAKTLKKAGFLESIDSKDGVISVKLSYRKKAPVLMDVKLISKPGVRIYWGIAELEDIKGPEIYIISTPGGVMSSKDAIKKRVGGEVIAKIW